MQWNMPTRPASLLAAVGSPQQQVKLLEGKKEKVGMPVTAAAVLTKQQNAARDGGQGQGQAPAPGQEADTDIQPCANHDAADGAQLHQRVEPAPPLGGRHLCLQHDICILESQRGLWACAEAGAGCRDWQARVMPG